MGVLRGASGFRAGLVLCALGIGSYVVVALQAPLGANLVRHVAWFLFAFVAYLGAVALVLASERRGWGPGSARTDLVLILVVALLLRGGLLATSPSLSDDVFRYVWDGKLQNAGLSPNLYAPSAPELAHLRTPLWEGINHKEMISPYPPAAEALFALVYRLAPDSLLSMQVMAVVFDLGVLLLLLPMLSHWGVDRRRAIVWAWNPLVLLQFSHSAHYDSAMILALLVAIYLLALGRRVLGGAALGLSVLVKLVPAMLAPIFLPLLSLPGLLAAGAVVVGGLAPWFLDGTSVSGLLSEAGDARFNDSLGYLFTRLAALVSDNPELLARSLANLLVVVASLLIGAHLWLRGSGWKGLLVGSYWLVGLFLLLNAVVEPWYLTWMIPFLCFALSSSSQGIPRPTPALGWLLLSGTIVLTDLTYSPQFGGSAWVWVRAVEYLPLLALLSASLWGMVIARLWRPASALR